MLQSCCCGGTAGCKLLVIMLVQMEKSNSFLSAIIAFAFNAKTFAIAILVFFFFFSFSSLFETDCKKLSNKRFIKVTKKACDQDLTYSLGTLKSLPIKIVPQVVIRDACGT